MEERPSTDLLPTILRICGIFRMPEPPIMAKPTDFDSVNLMHSLSERSNAKNFSIQCSLKMKYLTVILSVLFLWNLPSVLVGSSYVSALATLVIANKTMAIAKILKSTDFIFLS